MGSGGVRPGRRVGVVRAQRPQLLPLLRILGFQEGSCRLSSSSSSSFCGVRRRSREAEEIGWITLCLPARPSNFDSARKLT